MTLVEVLVALMIIVIVSVVMVSGFTTMANLDMKNTDRVNTDAGLSEVIAVSGVSDAPLPSDSPYSGEDLAATQLTMSSTSPASGPWNIPIKSKRYTDASGSGFTVFDFYQE
jgi:hypothetical protein